MKIICVIPAYNEESAIYDVVSQVKQQVNTVLVVNDGSTDKTGELAHAAGATVLNHLINRGQGAALKTGTDYALKIGADVIIHFDADGQFLATDIPKFITALTAGESDIVFGSRFIAADKQNAIPKFKKNIIIPLARLANRLFLGVRLTDPQSGFRAMTSRTARIINWQQDDMAHCSEILFLAQKHQLNFYEVPIKVIYKKFGQKLSHGFKILKDLLIARVIN
jgi:glycosyltransferase involved in cell wall biosynthesis